MHKCFTPTLLMLSILGYNTMLFTLSLWMLCMYGFCNIVFVDPNWFYIDVGASSTRNFGEVSFIGS